MERIQKASLWELAEFLTNPPSPWTLNHHLFTPHSLKFSHLVESVASLTLYSSYLKLDPNRRKLPTGKLLLMRETVATTLPQPCCDSTPARPHSSLPASSSVLPGDIPTILPLRPVFLLLKRPWFEKFFLPSPVKSTSSIFIFCY